MEHDFRLICAGCLAALSREGTKARRSWVPVAPVVQAVIGLVLSWLFFSMICGRLHDDPAAIHKGFKWSASEATTPASESDGPDEDE